MGLAPEEEKSGGIPEWVVTFGDMMSLLLTFFIMLVSLSELKEEQKYQAMVESMTRRFGYESALKSFAPGRSKPRNAMIAKVANEGRARRLDLMQGGNKVQAPTGDHPRVRIVRPGQKASSGTVIFFPEGSAELDKIARKELDSTIDTLGGQPQKIEIRGHTSRKPLPPNSPYANHWELAYARSANTFDYLTQKEGIDPRRLRISVAGPHEPMHLGSDPLARRENPRVEVFVLDEVVSDLMGTKDELEKRFTDGDLP
jgi:chemotaxis protein MotB